MIPPVRTVHSADDTGLGSKLRDRHNLVLPLHRFNGMLDFRSRLESRSLVASSRTRMSASCRRPRASATRLFLPTRQADVLVTELRLIPVQQFVDKLIHTGDPTHAIQLGLRYLPLSDGKIVFERIHEDIRVLPHYGYPLAPRLNIKAVDRLRTPRPEGKWPSSFRRRTGRRIQ